MVVIIRLLNLQEGEGGEVDRGVKSRAEKPDGVL